MQSIIRPDDKGDADDVVISDVTMFRLERMGKGSWWGAAYRGNQRFSFWLSSKSKIEIHYEDELGCGDDSDETAALVTTMRVLDDRGELTIEKLKELGVLKSDAVNTPVAGQTGTGAKG